MENSITSRPIEKEILLLKIVLNQSGRVLCRDLDTRPVLIDLKMLFFFSRSTLTTEFLKINFAGNTKSILIV